MTGMGPISPKSGKRATSWAARLAAHPRCAEQVCRLQTHSDDRRDVVQGLAPVDILFAIDVVPREVLFENVAR